MDPTTAIAVATASFTVIKKGFSLSKDVYSMAGDIGKFMDAIDTVKSDHKEEKKKYNSVGEEALQTFIAHKKAQQMEADLRNFLIAHYGMNAWQDVLRVQAQIRKQRIAEKERKRAQIKQILETMFAIVVLIASLTGLYLFAMFLKG
jgi:small neutral amino acid transporter SnatA (MarC family)